DLARRRRLDLGPREVLLGRRQLSLELLDAGGGLRDLLLAKARRDLLELLRGLLEAAPGLAVGVAGLVEPRPGDVAGLEQRGLALEVSRLDRDIGLQASDAQPRDLDLLLAEALLGQLQLGLDLGELGLDLRALELELDIEQPRDDLAGLDV